jgi:hypothetical protein
MRVQRRVLNAFQHQSRAQKILRVQVGAAAKVAAAVLEQRR